MKRSLRFLLSVLSGVLLSLAWLGFPGWILFVAFLPLLLLDDFFVTEKLNFRGVSFFGHAFFVFLIWNILTTWWVMHASLAGAVAAILLNSFFMGLVWWLAHTARRNFKKNLGYLALVVFYISYEYIHYHWEIEWPWLTLGNGFANNVKMVQWYEFTGVFGGSLWILIVNILLFKILKHLSLKGAFSGILAEWIFLAFILLVPLSFSFGRYFNYSEKTDPHEIVIVQPNINPYNESHDASFSNQVLNKFVGLASSAVSETTDFIVGPETIFEQYWDESVLKNNYQYRGMVSLLRENPGTEMVFGAVTLNYYQEGDELSETARERIVNGQNVKFDIYNTALFVGYNGEPQFYHKSILVSGVEKMPYIKYLKFLNNLVIDLGGASGSYGTQPEPTNFTASNGVRIAAPICYESIFGEYISEFVRNGAHYIFIITNDGWWKDTPGYKQHMSYARLRAIETRRSIARSANTGISCFINQRGDVFQKTRWWEDAVLKGEINANDRITFYVEYGDYIARISSLISLLLILFMIVKSLLGKPKGNELPIE